MGWCEEDTQHKPFSKYICICTLNILEGGWREQKVLEKLQILLNGMNKTHHPCFLFSRSQTEPQYILITTFFTYKVPWWLVLVVYPLKIKGSGNFKAYVSTQQHKINKNEAKKSKKGSLSPLCCGIYSYPIFPSFCICITAHIDYNKVYTYIVHCIAQMLHYYHDHSFALLIATFALSLALFPFKCIYIEEFHSRI